MRVLLLSLAIGLLLAPALARGDGDDARRSGRGGGGGGDEDHDDDDREHNGRGRARPVELCLLSVSDWHARVDTASPLSAYFQLERSRCAHTLTFTAGDGMSGRAI